MRKVTREELMDLVQVGADLSELDVSGITDMSHMFDSSQFNGDISRWVRQPN